MKHLVTVEQAKAKLQLNPEIEPDSLIFSIESAVAAAQLHVASLIQSDFEVEEDVTHTFFLDADSFSNVRPEGVFRVFLPTGLVSNVSILYGDTWNTCTEELDPADYVVFAERGIVAIDEKHADKFVKVTYDKGVTQATQPDWLKELILTYVPIMFFAPTSNSKADTGINLRVLEDHANVLANAHLRSTAFCIRAMK